MTTITRLVPRLPSSDLARTIDFYSRWLGFTVGSMWPDEEPTFVIMVRDNLSLQFTLAAASPANTTLCMDVSDALALHGAMKDQLPIEWGPEVYWYGRREFAVRDPNGYLVILGEETDDAATVADE